MKKGRRKVHLPKPVKVYRRHFFERARERYNIDFTDNLELYYQICASISDGILVGHVTEATFIIASSHTRTVWHICLDNGTSMVVVYSKEFHELVTALPPNCLEVANYDDEELNV